MEYTYGKASDSIDDTAKKVTKNALVINFFGDNPFANKEQPKTIDVEHKEGEDENA